MELSRSDIIFLFCIFSSYFLCCVCISIPAPFLPREGENHQQNVAVTGWMLGILPLAQCCSHVVWGKLTVKVGAKRTLVGGLMGCGLLLSSFGCLDFVPDDMGVLFSVTGFVIRILQSVCVAAVFTTSMTLVTDLFSVKKTLILSLLTSIGGMGMMCGPAIGSGFFKIGGFWLVFVATGLIICIFSIIMIPLLPNHDSRIEDQPNLTIPIRHILCNARMLLSLFIGMFSAAMWSAIDPILEPELRHQYYFREDQSALVFLALSGSYVFTSPVAGHLIGTKRCVDDLWAMLFGLIVSMAGLFFAGPSSWLGDFDRPLWLLVTCLTTMGLVNCLLYVPAQDIVFDVDKLELPSSTNVTSVKSLISGIWNGCYSFGTFFGMAFSGTSAEYLGWRMTLTIYFCGCLALAIITIAIKISEISLTRGEGDKKLDGSEDFVAFVE